MNYVAQQSQTQQCQPLCESRYLFKFSEDQLFFIISSCVSECQSSSASLGNACQPACSSICAQSCAAAVENYTSSQKLAGKNSGGYADESGHNNCTRTANVRS